MVGRGQTCELEAYRVHLRLNGRFWVAAHRQVAAVGLDSALAVAERRGQTPLPPQEVGQVRDAGGTEPAASPHGARSGLRITRALMQPGEQELRIVGLSPARAACEDGIRGSQLLPGTGGTRENGV